MTWRDDPADIAAAWREDDAMQDRDPEGDRLLFAAEARDNLARCCDGETCPLRKRGQQPAARLLAAAPDPYDYDA